MSYDRLSLLFCRGKKCCSLLAVETRNRKTLGVVPVTNSAEWRSKILAIMHYSVHCTTSNNISEN